MEQSYHDQFSKATLTGVFAGLVATMICLGYNFYYRAETGFPLAALINVSTLIVAVNLLFLLLGMEYYLFRNLFRRMGDLAFMLVSAGLTVLAVLGAMHIHRSDDPLLNAEFHHFLAGMIIIMGIVAVAGIPILFHNRKFQDAVI